MSEQNGLTIIAYIIGLLPGAYFFYRLVREIVYYFQRDDEDVL